MMLVWRIGKQWIIVLLAVIAVLSLSLAHWGAYTNPTPTFFLLPTRGWEILLGSFIAFFYNRSRDIKINVLLSQVMSLVGLLCIIFSIFIYDKQIPFPSLYALIPTLGAALVITFTTPRTFVYRVLSNKVFVFIGVVSYSAYLWHQPMFAFAKNITHSEPPFWLMALLSVASFLFAYLTWKYIETPFRRGKILTTKWMVVSFVVISVVFITIGIIGHKTDGFEEYFIENRLNAEQRKTFLLIKESSKFNTVKDGECKLWARSLSSDLIKKIDTCYSKHGPAVIVLGDSHATNQYNILAKANISPFIVGLSQGGCRVQNNKKKCHYDSFETYIDENFNKVKVVFFHQSGSYFVEDKRGKVDSNLAFKKNEPYAIRSDDIDTVIDYVKKLKAKIKTIWVGPFVEARVNLLSLVFSQENIEPKLNSKSLRVFKELELRIADRLIQKDNDSEILYISLNKWMNIQEDFLLVGNCFTYMDVDHFSRCGEAILAKELKDKFYDVNF